MPHTESFPSLILTVPLSQVYSQTNKKVISTIKLKGLGIHSKSQPLLQKTCPFHASETLATYAGMCLCTHALACIHRLLLTYVGRGLLWSFYFQK